MHAGLRIRRDNRIDLVGLFFANQIANGGVHNHDFEHWHAPAIDGGHELLGNRRLQYHGKLNAHLALLAWRECVNDALDGVGGAGGVQRGKHELRHFGRVHGGADGFGVAHFAKQNHVRALAHGRAQRLGERGDVGRHFALRDNAGTMLVHVLDGVFHRNNVSRAAVVHAVEQACECGRFA